MSFIHTKDKWYREGVHRSIPAMFCKKEDCDFIHLIFEDGHKPVPTSCPRCAERREFTSDSISSPKQTSLFSAMAKPTNKPSGATSEDIHTAILAVGSKLEQRSLDWEVFGYYCPENDITSVSINFHGSDKDILAELYTALVSIEQEPSVKNPVAG